MTRSAAAIAIALIALFVLVSSAPSALAEICTIGSGAQKVEYQCGSGDGGSSSSAGSNEPWWATGTAQASYAFIGLAASAGGGAYAFLRVKRRRETFATFMHRIDETLASSKAEPAAGASALASIRVEMRTAFHGGKFDDSHFIELDKRALGAMLKLRLLELDQRFPQLPVSLRSQIATLIGDGNVTSSEVDLVRSASAAAPMAGRTRDELMALLLDWARIDAESGAVASTSAPRAPRGAGASTASAPVLVRTVEPAEAREVPVAEAPRPSAVMTRIIRER